MGSNVPSCKSSRSFSSSKSSLLSPWGDPGDDAPTIINRTLSDGSHQSVVTQGGTKHELTNDTLCEITEYTKAFITSLQDYLLYFRKEINLVSPGQLSKDLTTPLTSTQITIDRLLDIGAPETKDIARFTAHDPLNIIKIVENFTSSTFPTYVTLVETLPLNDLVPYASNAYDFPARALKEAEFYRNEILKAWSLTTRSGATVAPCEFGKRSVWSKLQAEPKTALLCHRPALNRPRLPLDVVHAAFYEFVKKAEPGPGDEWVKWAESHVAAKALCKHLTDPLESEMHRASLILEEFKKVFPESPQFRWRMEHNIERGRIDLVYQRVLTSDYHPRFPQQSKMQYATNLIIIEIKLEEGNGDAFMQVSRYYGNIVQGNPRYYETGAPMFLITMSGPNIKFCGGWADNPEYGASIDVFETHFACLDVADRHRWELAKSIYSLSRAIKCLPSCHIPSSGRIIKDLPSIFTSFKLCDPQQAVIYGLHLLTPLPSDLRLSVFGAFAYPYGTNPNLSNQEINCVAKLIYRHYGVAVHQALGSFAPALYGWSENPGIDARVYVMEYLFPPNLNSEGWLTLTTLGLNKAAAKLDFIFQVLEEIVDRLMKHKLVHGDLRPNNLMVKMTHSDEIAQPVQIKVVDFEWGGEVGSARYPHNRNEDVGYPGEPGGLIGWRDDFIMIDNWRKSMEEYTVRNSGVQYDVWRP